MDETSKTNKLRSKAFVKQYLSGNILDIGCGQDIIAPNAEAFDLAHGDANNILLYKQTRSYDCVHSSHCLEHMHDVPKVLSDWWQLVKPGGYMITVVPDEDLYEQGIWPSIFNSDHKATFRMNGKESWSPVSYNITDLMKCLPNAELIEAGNQELGYDHSIQGLKLNKIAYKIFNWSCRERSIKGRIGKFIIDQYKPWIIENCVSESGQPVDQTKGKALAQIQIIIRKANVPI